MRILDGVHAPPDAREIWREVEIAGNQTLEDLGEFIPLAFEFDDPHMWSFFLSGKAWDRSSEYGLDYVVEADGETIRPPASEVLIRDVPYPGKTGKREFLYIFDFGDEWHFGVKLLKTSDQVDPGAEYPRVVAGRGEAPLQYGEFGEDEEE